MIEPQLLGQPLIDDVNSCHTSTFALWWLGQSGFLLKTPQGLALLDPYLSESLTAKYANTDKPHVRMTRAPLTPDQLKQFPIDVATSSHNHTDHLDNETLQPLLTQRPELPLVIPEANRDFVADRLAMPADEPLGLDAGQSINVGNFTVHGIAAAHDQLDRDEQGRCPYLGYCLEFGEHCIYHSGDTLWHEELLSQLSPFSIDVAILPINGKLPTRRVSGNLWGQEAAALAKTIGAKMVIPCHYDMFTFNTESTDAFREACTRLDQAFRVLQCGERFVWVGG